MPFLNKRILRETINSMVKAGKTDHEPEHLVVTESKEVLKNWWEHVKKTQESTKGSPND